MIAVTAAEKVLIAGRVRNLGYGALLGYPITVIRVKGAPATRSYLMAAHVGALLHAAVLLGPVGRPGCLRWARAGRMWPPGWSLSPPRWSPQRTR